MLKALLGRLEEDERQELERLLDEPAMGEAFEKLGDTAFTGRRLREQDAYDWEEAYRRFAKGRKTKGRLHSLVLKTAGAAAGLALVAGGLWWGARPAERGLPQTAQKTASPAFRYDRAILLTLADGRQITVGRQDTVVLTEYGTRVDYANGRLSYEQQETPAETPAYNELSVPLGGECVVDLDDGTRVWLNSGTRLRYPVAFGGGEREVFLEGEAYFDVSKEERPFVVRFPEGRVQVLGTEFGVRSYGEDSCRYATLVEGLVRVYTEEGDSLEVLPGEQAVITPREFAKREVRVDEYVGWKEGMLVFRQRPLGEIATQLEKWYDVKILFSNEELTRVRFTGYIKRYDNVEILFDALRRTGRIGYRIEGNHVFVSDN